MKKKRDKNEGRFKNKRTRSVCLLSLFSENEIKHCCCIEFTDLNLLHKKIHLENMMQNFSSICSCE